MSAATWIEPAIHFGAGIAADVDALLQQAAASPSPIRREALLKDAYLKDPHELAVHIARYKFYFYAGRTAEAEVVVRDALAKAACQGGFDPDCAHLDGIDFAAAEPDSPRRHFLYSLKALAFIELRKGRAAAAASVLDHLARLDPLDLVGASVVRDIAEGSAGAR